MDNIPVVDFSSLSLAISDDAKLNEDEVKKTADQLMDAFTSIGFVYLSNTGFPQQLVLQPNISVQSSKAICIAQLSRMSHCAAAARKPCGTF